MNLLEFANNIEKNKIEIVKIWVSYPSIKNIISNRINEDIFIKRYAFSVVEYYLCLIKDEEELFDKNKILDFLKYLKKQNIRVNELYLICNSFKNSLIDYSYKLNIQNLSLVEKINFYFEENFSNMLDIYSKSIEQIESALNKSIDIVDKYVMISKTDISGRIISVSTAFCENSGYKSFELVGKNHKILRHPATPKETFFNLWKTILSGNVWQGRIINKKKNGEDFWADLTIHPNFDNKGKIVNFNAIMKDVTYEVELKNQQDLLVEKSKLAAMGEMITMIAHQWRQPLQILSLSIQKLLLSKQIDGEIKDEVLEKITEQSMSQIDYMSKTVDDFRDYFKPNKQKEIVFIKDAVEKSFDFLKYLFKINNVNIYYKNESTSKIGIYLNEIIQVFINLMRNSCDAMNERKIENREISVYSYEKESILYIEFSDNAGGIPEDIINKIFEPYFSTKNEKNGTGIGLYMSKIIVERHSGGNLYVENIENGAKFVVELPIILGV